MCHLSRTLPPKEPWHEPQNRSSPPHHQTMPSYLWPMTLLCPVLAGYMLVRSGLCACLLSMYVQKSAYYSFVCRGLKASLYSLPFILWPFMWAAFWFSAPLKSWYLFVIGLYTSFDPFLHFPHFLPYYSVIPTVMTQSCWASLGLPFILSPSGLTWPLVFLLMGSCVPFVFLLGILGPFASFGLSHPFY